MIGIPRIRFSHDGIHVHDIECFVDTPWHVRQPLADPLDLSLSDQEILTQTEAACRDARDFQPMESWKEALARRLAEK